VLIMHGGDNHATLPVGSQEFFDKAGSKDKQIKLYPGHYHDLLADIGKEECWPTSKRGWTSGCSGTLTPRAALAIYPP
jgi:acylglycerol lipase